MGQVLVEAIGPVEPNAFNGLTKITFLSGGRPVYMFCRPGNEPKAGETLDGDITNDKQGNAKFTKTKNAEWQNQGAPSTYNGPKKGQSFGGGRDDKAIQAQWAIGQAVQLHNNESPGAAFSLENVEVTAKELFAMIDRVKTSSLEKSTAATFSDGRPVPTEAPTEVSDQELIDFFGGAKEIS